MDALPVTLGGEFAAYATAITRARDAIAEAQKTLEPVALGATAVGTGANTPKGYREAAIAELAEISGLPLVPEQDMQYALQSRFAVAKGVRVIAELGAGAWQARKRHQADGIGTRCGSLGAWNSRGARRLVDSCQER